MKKFSFLLFTILALVSCSSDDATSDVVLLKKYVVTDTDGGVSTTTVTYDGTKFATIIYSSGMAVDFTYTGNLITQIEYYNAGVLYQTELFTYDSSERLSSYVRLYNNNNSGVKRVCSYNADGTATVLIYSGNLTEQTDLDSSETISFLVNGEVTAIEEGSLGFNRSYTYDEKNNPYKNVTGYGKISWSRGVASGIVHNVTSEIIDTNPFTFTYTYNADNYPTLMAKTYPGGEVSTTKFFYED